MLFYCSFFSSAQQLKYKTYNVNNGLSQNTIWDCHIDFKGFLWIGTADGINRCDGEHVIGYNPDPTRKSFIQTDVVFHFFEDKKFQLWASSSKGIGWYNRSFDTFETVYLTKENCILLGDDEKNRLWIVDGKEQLIAFDKQTKKIVKKITLPNTTRHNTNSTDNALQIPTGFVAVLDERCVLYFNKKTERFSISCFNEPTGSYLGRVNDSIFVSYRRGVWFRYFLIGDSILIKKTLVPENIVASSFTGFVKTEDKLWASSDMGLHELDTSSFQIKSNLLNFYDKDQREFTYLQTIKLDHKKQWFLCTNGAGLKVYSPYSNKFKHYCTSSELNNMVKAICVAPNGTIFTGLWGRGIVAYEPNGKYKVLNFSNKKGLNSVLALSNWNDQQILFAQGNELIFYNHLKDKIERRVPLKDSFIFTYPQIKDKRLVNYDGPGKAGIAIISDKGKVSTLFEINSKPFRCFHSLDSNRFLISSNYYLLAYHLNSKRVDTVLSNIVVKSIFKSARNKIWLASTSGLLEMDSSLKVLRQWTTNNGLPNNFLYSILEDKDQNLWFSHNKGVSKLNLPTASFEHYTVADGMQSNEFNTGAYYKDAQGLLYFGGVNGINVIDPQNIIKDHNAIPVSINQIFINDDLFPLDSAYNEIQGLKLNYEQNTLSFAFSALEFCRPEACKYRYKLEGYDNQWIESGTVHFARYANIAPGNYTFKILACNPDGYWATSPKELHIFIKAPFWQTPLFRVALAIVLLSFVAFFIKLLLNRQKQKAKRQLEIQKELETERVRISRDLHDNVGAHLSYVINNIDWMHEHPDALNPIQKSDRLKLLSEAGRNALHTLRQTIWAFSQSAISVDDFADRFKQFALKMLELNSSVDIHFEEQFEANKQLNPSFALNLFRIAQEALNNALKHAKCNKIEVQFQSTEAWLMSILIRDNGLGFVPQDFKDSDTYGLQNMEARAQEIGAELLIDSMPSKGTTIVIRIKNLDQ